MLRPEYLVVLVKLEERVADGSVNHHVVKAWRGEVITIVAHAADGVVNIVLVQRADGVFDVLIFLM